MGPKWKGEEKRAHLDEYPQQREDLRPLHGGENREGGGARVLGRAELKEERVNSTA